MSFFNMIYHHKRQQMPVLPYISADGRVIVDVSKWQSYRTVDVSKWQRYRRCQ